MGWLWLWIALGLILRFTCLTGKAVWTDEFATLVFSLGNSFRTVPVDQVIPLADLLAPLQPLPGATAQAVVQHLTSESNHPPLYFLLNFWWLQLFPTRPDGLASIWAVRSLAALFGVLSIPAMFGLSWLTFRSWRIAHLAAALTAVSPFGVYLAQEARHYTLPILWVIASLACLMVVVQKLGQGSPPPWWVCWLWIAVNGLGMATHYFMGIALVAEGAVILATAIWQRRRDGHLKPTLWLRVGVAIAGTLASILIWIPVVQNVEGSELTEWISRPRQGLLDWILPIGRLFTSWMTMLYVLPVQADQLWLAILSGTVGLMLFGWTAIHLHRGWQRAQHVHDLMAMRVMIGFVVGAIAVMLVITYGLNYDLTLAFRYAFIYYPAVLLLIAAALSAYSPNAFKTALPVSSPSFWGRLRGWLIRPSRHHFVVLVLTMSLVSSLLVVFNLGFLKTHQPDQVVYWMEDDASDRTLVAMTHRTHAQTGRLMGIGLEWRRVLPDVAEPEVLLAHQPPGEPNQALVTLEAAIANYPRPFDLWMVSFRPVSDELRRDMLDRQNCEGDTKRRRAEGYSFRRYKCSALENAASNNA
ncbi:glycosyltransferase family 39 protein [Vacuolonema iberomarrocanum]|uniref:glycosyltransferase family 39 protein n=1 Tax=Vacuolonema iberomarrocanum TaxID=3454632 RepID=UPI001A0034D3|nr:glycosyltransferase [filamentous cyanobacterium LEGE 07170]